MTEQVTQTITMLDRSTKTLNKAKETLLKTMQELATLIDVSENLTNDIEFRASELAAIDKEMENKLRDAKAELVISIKENENEILNTLMQQRDLAHVPNDLYISLQEELEKAIGNNKEAISDAIHSVTSKLNTDHKHAQNALTATHDVATAELHASVTAKTNEINFLKMSLQTAQDTLQAEREARVSIAASEANAAGVTVNTSK